VAKTFHLDKESTIETPMATEELQPNQGQASSQEIYFYQRKIGSILYTTTICRPDAARATNRLSEYLLNPSQDHQNVANRIIQYLYKTKNLAIEYNGNRGEASPDIRCSTDAPNFRASSDAAFADDVMTRKSTEGYIFKLFGRAIDWKSTKQKTVTRSSTEAELLALSHASTKLY
jgi:hypothetical protein